MTRREPVPVTLTPAEEQLMGQARHRYALLREAMIAVLDDQPKQAERFYRMSLRAQRALERDHDTVRIARRGSNRLRQEFLDHYWYLTGWAGDVEIAFVDLVERRYGIDMGLIEDEEAGRDEGAS